MKRANSTGPKSLAAQSPARILLLALATLGPVACTDRAASPEAPATTEASPAVQASRSWADPDAPAGIAVTNGRMVLPAVAGNPGALYFTIRNTGDTPQAIRSVFVSGAQISMLHQSVRESGTVTMRDVTQLPVPVGATIELAPGGLHVMAMDVAERLEEGGQTEATITFASGDKASFPAEIRAPGDSDATTGSQ